MSFTDVLCLQMNKKRRGSETHRKSCIESGGDEQVTKPARDRRSRARQTKPSARAERSREEVARGREGCTLEEKPQAKEKNARVREKTNGERHWLKSRRRQKRMRD